MKHIALYLSITIMLLFPQVCLAQAPKHLGGFTLGGDIADFEDRIQKDTTLTIRYQEYLAEVEIDQISGFKSGLITYGTCDKPGKIVRIKLKYNNSSKKFFDALMRRFEQRFGKPNEWRGDAFHVVIAWKWNFLDEQGNQISLTLQHNTMDQEEKMGNAVKMTLTNQIQKEDACYEKKHPPQQLPRGDRAGKGKLDWDLFVPK